MGLVASSELLFRMAALVRLSVPGHRHFAFLAKPGRAGAHPGIPWTEAQALRSRGDDYRRYQSEVSAFFPLPPKSSDNGAL